MSRSSLQSIALALCIIVTGSAAALALDNRANKRPEMDPRGEPDGLKKGVTECFKVWHNEEGWHVRVVNGKGTRDHRYQGVITIEGGIIEDMRSHLAQKNGAEKIWKQGPKKNEISFDFATNEREDGINFRASKGASAVRFSMRIDGRDVPDQIYVGKRGDHPDAGTFAVTAHPGENNPDKKVGGTIRKSGIR